MSKSDLEAFFDGQVVRLIFNKSELIQGAMLQKAKDLIGPESETLQFYKAEMVFLGGHVADIVSRTEVDKALELSWLIIHEGMVGVKENFSIG